MELEQIKGSNERFAEMGPTAKAPVRAAVRSLGWEGTRSAPELIAWVRCWTDDEEWGLRFEILPTLEVAPVSRVGRSEVRFAAHAAVERYLGANQHELHWLLQFRPRRIYVAKAEQRLLTP
jgi:hypothetical protein